MSISASTKLAFVTVFDAKVYAIDTTDWSLLTPTGVLGIYRTAGATPPYSTDMAGHTAIATINSLSTSNLVATGPELTIQGGVDNNVLIKHGKSMRCEMKDVLANTIALKELGMVEFGNDGEIHTSEKFGKPVTIIGTTILINEASGEEETHLIIIYKFLPDSIINLNLGADSAAVFDLNGDVEAVQLSIGPSFYSIY